MPVDNMGRELIELVQIDQDFCNNTFSEGACGARKLEDYQLTLNGTGYIETGRRWNPDATDPSFRFEFYGDINQVGGYICQSEVTSSLDAEFAIFRSGGSSPESSVRLGGSSFGFSHEAGVGRWAFEFTGTAFRVLKNEVEVGSVPASIGTAREPLAKMYLGALSKVNIHYFHGIFSNAKFYTEINTVNNLVLDMPINDNSDNITDDSTLLDDGLLSVGAGSWEFISNTECFNTFATCQNLPNYDKGSKTITFKRDQSGGLDIYAIPSLSAFKVSMPELNIGARKTKTKSLGRFGSCSVSFNDLPFSDNHLDPYVLERDYNPLERGTFWTKFLARNPFYNDWKIRLYDGFAGQTLEQMSVREYRIDKITNPNSSGMVTVTANDLMRKTSLGKAVYPPVSNTQLRDNISDTDTDIFTVGRLAEFDGSGPPFSINTFAQIGDEVVRVFTPIDQGGGIFLYQNVQRGEGSEATAHNAGDSLEYLIALQGDVSLIITYLMREFFTSDEFDYAGMTLEADTYLNYSIAGTINKPTNLDEILSKIAAQVGFYIWYDDAESIIKFKAIRDEQDPVKTYDQNINILQGSASPTVLPFDRITDAYIQYDVIDSVLPIPSDAKYLNTLLDADLEAASTNEYSEMVTLKIEGDWIVNSQLAGDIATKYLKLFRDQTRSLQFQLDIKDNIKMAEVFKLKHRGFTNIYGEDELINWICTGRTRKGDVLHITAQEFKFNVPV